MKKCWWALLIMGAGLAWAASCSKRELRAPRSPSAEGTTLAVLSYNLNYGLAGDTPTLEAIAERPAELILLQETTAEWEAALRARFGGEYSHVAFRHCCLAGGLGVLSKYPFEELEYIEPPQGGFFPAWRLGVTTPFGELQVLNVHLRPQLGDSGANIGGVLSGMVTTPPVRRREIEAYAAYIEHGTPTVIAGDFNESEDGGALEWLAARGFRSAVPDYTHEDTWSWQTSLGRVSRRFDHIVHSRELRVLSAGVVQAGRSDHLPVFAVLEPAP